MLIRCKIDRGPEGTHLEFPEGGPYKTVAGAYHFAVNKKGDAVAEVTEPTHLAFCLGVASETYEVYETDGRKKKPAAPVEPEPEPAPVEDPLQPLVPEKGDE
jgi:hypothetical protein